VDASLAIRPCRADECAAVLALWREADAVPSVTDTADELARLCRDHGEALLVAEADGRLVGTIIAAWDGWRGNIYRLAVRPSHRRRGIARALVLEAERRLAARGARRFTILVARDEPHAVAFWDSLADAGYRRDPGMMRFVGDVK